MTVITGFGDLVIKSLYFFIPAGITNMMPVLVKKINFLNYPVDFKKSFNGIRILGDNKTFRGYFFGIIAAIIVVALQAYLVKYESTRAITVVDFSVVNPYLFGFLLGFGVLFGDSVKSFFKRRANIKPGQPWIPFDQLDLIIGGLLFISIVYIPPVSMIVFAFIVGPLLHIGFNLLGYYLGIKKNKL